MATLSISLPDELRAAAETAVVSGRFATISEYVATLIRRDQLREGHNTQSFLRHRTQAGPAADLSDTHFDRIRARLDLEIAKRLNRRL